MCRRLYLSSLPAKRYKQEVDQEGRHATRLSLLVFRQVTVYLIEKKSHYAKTEGC